MNSSPCRVILPPGRVPFWAELLANEAQTDSTPSMQSPHRSSQGEAPLRTNSKPFYIENKARESPPGRGRAQPVLRNKHLVGVCFVAFGFSE